MLEVITVIPSGRRQNQGVRSDFRPPLFHPTGITKLMESDALITELV